MSPEAPGPIPLSRCSGMLCSEKVNISLSGHNNVRYIGSEYAKQEETDPSLKLKLSRVASVIHNPYQTHAVILCTLLSCTI